MGAIPKLKFSVEEYLTLDRQAERKSEYHEGELFPVIDASIEHSSLGVNLAAILQPKLRKTGCRALFFLRTRVSPSQYVYPDLAILCGEPKLTDEHADTVTNPKVIFEILSPSTADYDHGGKFALYRMLPSFEEYVLISQDRMYVEVFRKRSSNDWSLQIIEDPSQTVRIESVGIEFVLGDLYEGVLS